MSGADGALLGLILLAVVLALRAVRQGQPRGGSARGARAATAERERGNHRRASARPRKEGITMDRKLYRAEEGKMIAGVCAGLAEYFAIDPTLVRLAWVLFCALGGSGVLAYIICALIIPSKSQV